jgi:SAM-dependent methyltransferase
MATTTDHHRLEVLASLKRQARETWAAGDYDAVAEGIWEVGERVVKRVGVAPGERVLDVACGTGNAAIRAAAAGGTVTGLDITPELLTAARRRAADAGVAVEWVVGDAEELPFENESFDVVLSTFGVMFAPRHEIAAREIARVLRPGGRMAIASWAPDGTIGDFFATFADHLPPQPEIAAPPLLWGREDHLRRIFDGHALSLAFDREELPVDPGVSPDEAADFYIASFGPLVKAREVLEFEGAWASFLDEVVPRIRRFVTEPAAYLLVTGTKAR